MYKKLAKLSSLAVAMGRRGLYELDKSANAEILLFLCFFMCTPFQAFFFQAQKYFLYLSFHTFIPTYFLDFFFGFQIFKKSKYYLAPGKNNHIYHILNQWRIQDLAQGGGWETPHSPLYPLLSSITYFINKKITVSVLATFSSSAIQPRNQMTS